MKTIDLCCGIGGIRRGFELAGDFENVLSAEKDEYACRTYQHLFGDDPRHDVTDEAFKELVTRTEYDVLLAGFPCQAFSKVGLRKGFRDVTKGTIFFDIVEIIDRTMPKVVFLENVENLVSHNKGETFRIILNTLENELNYHVIGVERDEKGELTFDKKSFIRNTKNFGLPQNRPRVYMVAFSRDYFGKHLDVLPKETPTEGRKEIFHSVLDILDTEVSERFFLSSGLLETLEKHRARQKSNGNGFGYRVVNDTSITRPLAHTILATGGSGKERNLIYDPVNGRDIAGTDVKGKKTPINEKCIRTMTPEEWERLQGFIGYAFLDGKGKETFSFPEKMSNQQKFKQFGNSVSIPLIEEMALFIKDCVTRMEAEFSEEERVHYEIPGALLKVQNDIRKLLKNEKPKTVEKCCRLVSEIGLSNGFRAEDIGTALGQSNVTAYNYLHRLERAKCVEFDSDGYKLRAEKKNFRLKCNAKGGSPVEVEYLKKIMKKCDIYFEDQLISGELLLQSFMDFLADEAGREENNGSIVLHLASPCFDAIAVAWAALTVIAGNEKDVESIIRNLRPGDKVLYDRKRAEFIGLNTDEDGVERVSIRYGGGTARIGRKSWARITPYYGQSERYDGRGIRRGNRVREEFLATLLECDKKDIPSVTDASVIIVMGRQRANRCMDGLVLQAGNLKIRLQDLVTASYFTEGNEYSYGGNAGKNEAMIKFASKISVGLDMTWESDGNEYLGMLICGNGLIERGITELGQVMTRESVGFSVVSGGMDLPCAEELIKEYGEAGVFACTKDFLLEHTLPPVNGNDLTVELQRQADAVMDREIHKVILHGETDWKAYRDFKKAVGYVRMDELDEDERAYIIPNAYSLMNLFMTAPFSVREMEDAVKEEKIRREVGQPHVRLEELEEKLKALPANLTQAAGKIADSLETAYYAGYDDSPKRRFLKEYIQENHGHWIAVVVPKAYYADIIWNYVLPELDPETSGIEIVTMARFDGTHAYDRILVVGNLIGKHFDIFRCMSSAEITVLLYEAEAVMFHAREKRSRVTERLFNERQCTADDGNDEIEENVSVTDVNEIENVDEKIASYTEEIVTKKFDAALRQEGENNTVPPVDVSVLVRFEDGEGAMLSKHYEAYVLNDEKGEAEKKKADDLKTGDRMIFLNRDEDTRDIVDYILKELIDGNRINEGNMRDYEMSRRWKNDLLEHMERTGHSPKKIAEEMKGNGVRVQKNTVMNWIDEDAHTVAPQSVESLEQIAYLTNDLDMFDHAAEYFEACKRIRRLRKDILKELGAAIIKFLEGQKAPEGIIPPEIRERLGTLAAVLRIETIIKDNRSVSAYMTNRPLDLDGGL